VKPKIEKIIGFTELVFAILTGIVCIASFKTAFFPSEQTHWEEPGWAIMNLIIIAPLSVSVAVSGLALLKDFRRKWLYQILPVIVLVCIAIFFWWADVGSMK
jgi:hypothetical protein